MWPGIPLYAVLLINNALWKGPNEFQLSSDESFRTTLVFVLFRQYLYTNIGRLAWPLHKDDPYNCEVFHIFMSTIYERTRL